MSSATSNGKVELVKDQSLAKLGAELLRRAAESQVGLTAAWEGLMTHWGVAGEPVGIARLREMIRQDRGADGVANEFSHELVALREERRP